MNHELDYKHDIEKYEQLCEMYRKEIERLKKENSENNSAIICDLKNKKESLAKLQECV